MRGSCEGEGRILNGGGEEIGEKDTVVRTGRRGEHRIPYLRRG